ncbi:MAG: N-acetyltransferase [Pseudomonadales bacterium]|nr:N-acetyltransferase [Pseudomonadales bacterium]
MLAVRPEAPADQEAIHRILCAAFPGDAEARLVQALRQQASPLLSLVAEQDGLLCGHILFSPAHLNCAENSLIMGLAPMAVEPAQQSRGIGSQLVSAGLTACRELGAIAVVVLGHPHYYPRFGFRAASEFGLVCDYEVPAEAFMALELQPGSLAGVSGTVHYHPCFAAL